MGTSVSRGRLVADAVYRAGHPAPRAAEEIVMARDADITILRKRGMLATGHGVVAQRVGGAGFETAPCDMLLGNAILHVSRLDASVCTTAGASVVAEGITLNCEDCRRLALKYGDKLEVRE